MILRTVGLKKSINSHHFSQNISNRQLCFSSMIFHFCASAHTNSTNIHFFEMYFCDSQFIYLFFFHLIFKTFYFHLVSYVCFDIRSFGVTATTKTTHKCDSSLMFSMNLHIFRIIKSILCEYFCYFVVCFFFFLVLFKTKNTLQKHFI